MALLVRGVIVSVSPFNENESGDVRTFPRLLHAVFRLCTRERVEEYDEEDDAKRFSDVHGATAYQKHPYSLISNTQPDDASQSITS